jgi:tetratricopeptide (TPR) repeat protein
MPEREGRKAFLKGIDACPKSVHLWQAWAVYEESCGNTDKAAELFQEALRLDKRNAYVCHAFGLMEKKLGNTNHAKELFAQALEIKPTAALVCSMGEILIANKDYRQTRDLYARHVLRLDKEKDKTEVYLSSAWLEEKYYADYDRAKELILLALAVSPASGLAQVALARLEGRIERRQNKNRTSGTAATVRRLENACKNIEEGASDASTPKDGRLYNTWANMEVKSKNYSSARKILNKGMAVYPDDYSVSFKLRMLAVGFWPCN